MNTKVVTFDCYGTLIDWDRGVLSAVRSSCPASIFLDDRTVLQAFDQAEAIELSGCYRPYQDVLAGTGRSIARKFNLGSSELASALSTSVGGWPAFDDTVSALTTVRDAFPSLRIGILSNIDTDLLQKTMRQQFGEFRPDFTITAESVRSYKPGLVVCRGFGWGGLCSAGFGGDVVGGGGPCEWLGVEVPVRGPGVDGVGELGDGVEAVGFEGFARQC